MATLIALWTAANDQAAFNADYTATHVKLCEALPGIVSVRTREAAPGGPFVRMSELEFADMGAVGAAFGGPEGAAIMADTGRLQETFGCKAESIFLP